MSNIDDIKNTIETVVRSPLLESYNIGITIDSKRRRAQYKNFTPTWPHYLILESGLLAHKALEMEREIQESVKSNKRSVLFKKYRGDTRHKPHTPSLGGLARDNEKLYDLYISWGNYGEN